MPLVLFKEFWIIFLLPSFLPSSLSHSIGFVFWLNFLHFYVTSFLSHCGFSFNINVPLILYTLFNEAFYGSGERFYLCSLKKLSTANAAAPSS